MTSWGDPYPFDDRDEGVDVFSLLVILAAFAVLTVWAVVAAGGPP